MVDVRLAKAVSVTESFNVFEEHLRLAPGERASAVTSHNGMTAYLLAEGAAVAAFLQGSFRRKTMRRPLRDIDKVVILPDGLRSDLIGSANGPDRAMDLIQAALTRHYGSAVFERTRHALNVTLAAKSFSFDLVPAFESDEANDDVFIANRETGGWDRSNTRTLLRVVAERNQACGGRFVQQVRMAKEWASRVAEAASVEFPGLHTESLAFVAITEAMDHALACTRFFELGARAVLSPYSDPTGVDIISRKLKPGTAAVMAAAFTDAARRAREALACAAADDTETACRILGELLGDAFPVRPADREAAVFDAAFAGGSVVAGQVTPTRTGPQVMRPTRAWRP